MKDFKELIKEWLLVSNTTNLHHYDLMALYSLIKAGVSERADLPYLRSSFIEVAEEEQIEENFINQVVLRIETAYDCFEYLNNER